MMLGTSITSNAQDEVPYDMSGYRGDIGKTFLFYVTGDDSQSCYGGKDSIYTDDTPLSVAAVHAGLLKVKETKLIKVKVLTPATDFPSIKEGPIWGGRDNIYTSDSEIATAAIHAGVLKAGETGIVKLKMLPGLKSYPEVTRNGLTSHSFDSWEGSYQFLKMEEQ